MSSSSREPGLLARSLGDSSRAGTGPALGRVPETAPATHPVGVPSRNHQASDDGSAQNPAMSPSTFTGYGTSPMYGRGMAHLVRVPNPNPSWDPNQGLHSAFARSYHDTEASSSWAGAAGRSPIPQHGATAITGGDAGHHMIAGESPPFTSVSPNPVYGASPVFGRSLRHLVRVQTLNPSRVSTDQEDPFMRATLPSEGSAKDLQGALLTVPTLKGQDNPPRDGPPPPPPGGSDPGPQRSSSAAADKQQLSVAESQLQDWGRTDAGLAKALVYGSVNALVGLPALVAFAALVFREPIYEPYLGSLCKFFFFSSAVHQIVFVLMSTLPFSVGQVQDVGIIFLSSMATAIAVTCSSAELGVQVALGTTLLTFSIATFLVGLLTMLVGKFRLAQVVQYVPLPVVGGYLSYVGYFCLAGGASMAAGVQIDSLFSWGNVLTADALTKLGPLVLTVVTLMLATEHCTHPLVLPSVLVAVPLLFHVALLVTGHTLEEAQEAGWVMKPVEGSPYFWDLWRLFNLDFSDGWSNVFNGIYWPALIGQVPKMTGLFLVVCFGSCMDIAAIKQDVPKPLDFNSELMTVGTSNMVVALVGAGYTGSYIFSQTIFTLRAGVLNRFNGIVLAAIEIFVFVLPFSVLQYVPNFFFGALLLWFGVDIVRDWLLLSYMKLSQAEYILLWLSFFCIMTFGLEEGIGGGIVMATFYFAYEYAQSTVSTLRTVPASSGNMHSYNQQAVLEVLLPRRVAAVAMSGFIFFGNSISISGRVMKVADELVARAAADAAEERRQVVERCAAEAQAQAQASAAGLYLGGEADKGKDKPAAAAAAAAALSQLQRAASMRFSNATDAMRQTLAAIPDAPMFIILDFRLVPKLDATAARTFASLTSELAAKGLQILVSGIQPKSSDAIKGLLSAHGMFLTPHAPLELLSGEGEGQGRATAELPDAERPLLTDTWQDESLLQPAPLSPGQVWEFPSLEAAARFCEEQLLALAVLRGLLAPALPTVTLEEVLAAHAGQLQAAPEVLAPVAAAIKQRVTAVTLTRSQVLFQTGDAMDCVYIVEAGHLRLEPEPVRPLEPAAKAPGGWLKAVSSTKELSKQEGEGGVRHGAREYGPGCLVGAHDFYLHRPATATARCCSPSCRLMQLSRASFQALMAEAPTAFGLLQFVVTRSFSLDLAATMDLVGSHAG